MFCRDSLKHSLFASISSTRSQFPQSASFWSCESTFAFYYSIKRTDMNEIQWNHEIRCGNQWKSSAGASCRGTPDQSSWRDALKCSNKNQVANQLCGCCSFRLFGNHRPTSQGRQLWRNVTHKKLNERRCKLQKIWAWKKWNIHEYQI